MHNCGIYWLCLQHQRLCEASKTRVSANCTSVAGRVLLQLTDDVIAEGCADEAMVERLIVMLHRPGSIGHEGLWCYGWAWSFYYQRGHIPCSSRNCLLLRVETTLVLVVGMTTVRQRYYCSSTCPQVFVCKWVSAGYYLWEGSYHRLFCDLR